MVDHQPYLVARIAQLVERRLERPVHMAQGGLRGILTQMLQQPRPTTPEAP
ncbi:hypothetical protein ABZ079_04325 [Streptomyces sp. NPDC006314]|uniref:hypothetical protein n=1 Tax=Streptomyces sp. NPDC006314 TaxID=3154475 RepID=UPI0033B65072